MLQSMGGRKELDTTEQLNNKILKNMYVHI